MPPKEVLDIFASIDVPKDKIETIEFRGANVCFAAIPAPAQLPLLALLVGLARYRFITLLH